MAKKVKTYGKQLLIDGYGAAPEKLNSVKIVRSLLRSLPAKIGMHLWKGPFVWAYGGGNKPEDAGITGIAIITESHISIHSYFLKGFVTADIYSCKDFNTELATKLISEAFGVQKSEVQVISRGKRFPVNALTPTS